MATPTEPITDALYKALSSPEPDPQITELKAEMKAGFSEVNSRIDMLEKVIWRVIWPLIISVGRAYLRASLQGAYRLEGDFYFVAAQPWIETK